MTSSQLSSWAIPFLLAFIPLYGVLRGVKVYESFIEGAEEGIRLTLRLAPFMMGILIALGIFRESGALEGLTAALAPILNPIGFPTEIIPLVITRPISGSAAMGVTADLLKYYGPDTPIGYLASTMQGSTDTTFYILTVYFGSVGISKTRWALPVGLTADVAAFTMSTLLYHWMWRL